MGCRSLLQQIFLTLGSNSRLPKNTEEGVQKQMLTHTSDKYFYNVQTNLMGKRRTLQQSVLKHLAAAATAKSLQSCPTLCDPIDGSPPGTPVPGILQVRVLEWVAISFSNTWKWKVKVKSLSHVRPSATPWTAALQAPPSKGFSRQEDWSGVAFWLPRCKTGTGKGRGEGRNKQRSTLTLYYKQK